MYLCSNCDFRFEEAKKEVSHQSGSNLPDGGFDEVSYHCPQCGSANYNEVVICCVCYDEFFVEENKKYIHFKDNNEYVCNDIRCLSPYCRDNFS